VIDPDTPLELVPFVSVDLETTGLDPRRDEIVEIGAVRVLGGKLVDEWESLVSVSRGISRPARLVHGISREMLEGQPSIDQALPKLLEFAGDGALVEHSYEAFDLRFLEKANGGDLGLPSLNSYTLSRKLFPFLPAHGLDECCRRYHILRDERHRALSDARAAGALLVRLLEACYVKYPTLGDVLRVASVGKVVASHKRGAWAKGGPGRSASF
jgi:DNA polymerase III alpha subunit (gram-positive type)